jgi:hypothetical protein
MKGSGLLTDSASFTAQSKSSHRHLCRLGAISGGMFNW